MPFNNVTSRTDVQAMIPEEVSNIMLANLSSQSAALTMFQRIQIGTNQTRFPVLSALPTAYFVNGDTGLKQTTEMNWANKYINVEELAAIVPIPDAVLEDVNFDLWGAYRPRLEEAIGRALDAAVFFGANKPSSWDPAIVTAAVAAGNTVTRGTAAAAAGGIAQDFNNLFATVEADGYMVNGVIANTSYKAIFRGARGSDGQLLVDVNAATQNIWGAPVSYPMEGQWTTGSQAAEAVAGDFKQAILGVRRDFTYTMSNTAIIHDDSGNVIFNAFQQDMTLMRVVFRVGFAVANPINYQQQTESSRYPFAVMRAPV